MDTLEKGILIMAALLLLLLFSSQQAWAQPFGILSPQGQQESQKQVLSSPTGRFVFGQISDSSKDQFMLDTATGRLWRISERGDIGLYLSSVLYCTAEDKYSVLPEKITADKQK